MVVLDTNIIIDHIRTFRTEESESYLQSLLKEDLAISVITIQELYVGKSMDDEKNIRLVNKIIEPYTFLNYTPEIAMLAGAIGRNQYSKSYFADAAIAATCLKHDAKLATLNKKHFEGIGGLEFVEV